MRACLAARGAAPLVSATTRWRCSNSPNRSSAAPGTACSTAVCCGQQREKSGGRGRSGAGAGQPLCWLTGLALHQWQDPAGNTQLAVVPLYHARQYAAAASRAQARAVRGQRQGAPAAPSTGAAESSRRPDLAAEDFNLMLRRMVSCAGTTSAKKSFGSWLWTVCTWPARLQAYACGCGEAEDAGRKQRYEDPVQLSLSNV